MPPTHLGCDFCRIVARTEDDNVCATNPTQQAFEIAVGRDQDKPACACVLQNLEIAVAREPISQGAFELREQIAQQVYQLRRKALVEEKLRLLETLPSAA